MCIIDLDFALTSKSCCGDKHFDNFSGIEPTDMQKQQNNVDDSGPEYKFSDERKPLDKNDYCSQNYRFKPGEVVNISATQDEMVLLDSDTVPLNNDKEKDDGWSSELDNMPLLVRREMLAKDDGWSSEVDTMPLSLRREMLLGSKQSPRTDNMHSYVSPSSERSLMTNHDASMLEEEEMLNNSVRSSHKLSDIPGDCYIERDAIIQNNEPLDKKKMHPNVCNISAIHIGNSASSSEIKSLTLNPCNEPGRNNISPGLISLPSNSTMEVNVNIKVEPTIHDEETPPSKFSDVGDFKFGTIKTEENVNSDISDDKIDHMLLRERMKLLTTPGHSDPLKIMSMPDMGPDLGSVKPISIKRPWKKKRTATDSIQVALEEDAPGLLRALADSGVTVGEIKLYGNEEENELADEDESSGKDNFSELEDVIAQLFSHRQPLIKMGHPRSTKDAKATYCLTCLFALVEQTRYLQSRNWPVEWGWSRDLQAFIFIFKRHRRIVLERPEYGYATYFFELVDSLSVEWQIKRLVTAMKLSSCGRTTLMENKALLIGEDLSEGEARVLMQFGWTPNSGLGTMLNYSNRVVHDRRNEKDTSEWRTKIGKLLIDGYNGGSIVIMDTTETPVQVKPEL